MYVKSLTLKGFKSFASATDLVLEPGITCIVGPNGSGKSNVVDALAWVMGEGSARSLRGGKMDDVIFAGTSGRSPLGRAEVTMTIDNSDGALPIDYTEVTISRTMFRGGGSEYAINRTPCRLLDIQELLSDSGIGREMHVIVGQGQLDAVLRATPEERRGFIEEAAGVLKHRRRKEKALRKLDGMEANLTRVADLTAEVRRQLGPLGRQAETARRAQSIQMTVRDARLRLLADDLVQQRAALEGDLADERARVEKRTQLEGWLARAKDELAEQEAADAERTPVLERLQSQWYELSSRAEKLESTAVLASERAELLAGQDDTPQHSGRDPEQLRRQAERVRGEEQALRDDVARAQEAVNAAVATREQAESAHQEEQQRLVRLARAAADRREGLAKLHGQVEVRRSRVEAGEAELARVEQAVAQSRARTDEARAEVEQLTAALREAEEREVMLTHTAEIADATYAEARERRRVLRDEKNAAAQRRAGAAARCEALAAMLGSQRTSEDRLDQIDAVKGRLVDRLRVTPGYEAGVAVALGWASEALVIGSHDQADDVLAALRAEDAGRVDLVVADGFGGTQRSSNRANDEVEHPADAPRTAVVLPEDAVWVRNIVDVEPEIEIALTELLADTALVPDAAVARTLVREGCTAITADGDVYTPTSVRGGGRPAQSALEVRAALEAAEQARAMAETEEARAAQALEALAQPLADAELAADDAAHQLRESDSTIRDLTEQLARRHQTIASAGHELERIHASAEQANVALEANRAELEELEQRLLAAQEQPDEDEPSTVQRDALAQQASDARMAETEHRLTLRAREEQLRALTGRAESLEAAARAEDAARERAAARRARRAQAVQVARAVSEDARRAHALVMRAAQRLGALRDEEMEAKKQRDAAVLSVRSRVTELGEALREVTDSVHRDEVARAQQRLRIEALETRALDELGIEPDVLIEEFGPHQPVPNFEAPEGNNRGSAQPSQAGGSSEPSHTEDPQGPDATSDSPDAAGEPFERVVQEKRLRRAERDLKQLGKVNPLALEEYAALEERHTFLAEQLGDLRASKKDLLALVAEVDQRVEQVFSEAFRDVAEQFEGVFSRLFPGGEGRLVLTDPDDMLTTGLEVEARPPGKKIKRLSLLSGGERSLVAVALLVSIFKARPSPFYIMDEVEAALDDANLGRLITLFEELRDSSQLIVITHQKRTMEIADALYGVTMRGDGVTTVVSQRLSEVRPPAPAGEAAR